MIEYIDTLYNYAMVLTDDSSEAEDLVQKTYARAQKALRKLRTGSNTKGSLLTILRNIWLNQVRTQRATPQMVDIDVDESTVTIAVDASKVQQAYASTFEYQRVRKAIQSLPFDLREVIVLREYEALSYYEIASVLDCPVGTVISRLVTARSKLQTTLSRELQTALSSSSCGQHYSEGAS